MDKIGRKEVKNFDLLMDRSDFSMQEETFIYDPTKLCPCCNIPCCLKGFYLTIFLISLIFTAFYVLVMNNVFEDTLCFKEDQVLYCDISLNVGAIFPTNI